MDRGRGLRGGAGAVNRSIQERGTCDARALIGRVLQNRLAIALHDEAVTRSAQLPAAFRAQFVDGFSHAASKGLEIGSGQTGGTAALPPGLPPGVALPIGQLAHAVFANAFVDAARPTLLIPIGVLLAAALATVAVRSGKPATVAAEEEEEEPIAV